MTNEGTEAVIRNKPILTLLLCVFFAAFLNAQEVKLLFAGDAMQHQSQLENAFRNGKYDYSSYFQYVKNEISRADLAIVNLEGTLGGAPYKGYPMFCFPDAFAVALKEAGFTLFLTANNHALDTYSKGINRTIDVLDSLAVYHTGTFKNAFEREQNYPLIVEKNGVRMAFLNYTYDTNGLYPTTPCIVNYIDTTLIREDIRKARRLNSDVLIANMHWGQEYKLHPDKTQKKLAQFLMDEGVDLIIGSHPHVVQPSQILTDSTGRNTHLVVYSLGNFVSGMKAIHTDGGQMISVTLKKAEKKIQIESCGTILHYTQKKKVNGAIDFTLIPVSLAEKTQTLPNPDFIELDAYTYEKMMRFANNARDLFRQYNQGVNEYRISTQKQKADNFLKFIPIKFGFCEQICIFAPQK
jgi:poly-gamma-glutamate synthesis protein (capsule biosynthesis protein)